MAAESDTAALRDEVERLRNRIRRDAARIRGIEAELAALEQSANAPTPDAIAALPRTEAILAVLRDAAGTLSPTEILDALRVHGRSEELRVITATLSHLLNKGDITRAGRGRYLATA